MRRYVRAAVWRVVQAGRRDSERRYAAILARMDALVQRRLIGRFYDDMWNRFDKSVFPEILDSDIRFRGSLGQEKVGYTEFGEYVEFIAAFSPDFHNTVLVTITEDDQMPGCRIPAHTAAKSLVSSRPDGPSSTPAPQFSLSTTTASPRSGFSATSTVCSNNCAERSTFRDVTGGPRCGPAWPPAIGLRSARSVRITPSPA